LSEGGNIRPGRRGPPFDTEAEAIEAANAAPFGLAAYAFTRDLSRAFRLMEQIEAGMLAINDGLPTTTNAPFGGVKQSGWGRELGSEGLDAFLKPSMSPLSPEPLGSSTTL
jgi:succinate-semialdehyde dehydrogenase/glutarate-semialdehyde dehydrogenase